MKKRLDVLLVEQGYFPSREKAKAVIMAGQVYVDGQKEDKAGSVFEETLPIEVRGSTLRYVSRGGLKLEKALAVFGAESPQEGVVRLFDGRDLSVEGKVCMDIGASTGGFTDCMLQNGAVKVYSIDVGRGQLDWKLRNDPRVVCMERFNVRYLTPEDLPETPDFSSIDVSFISLKKILPPVVSVLRDHGQIVALIKPQFEAGREKVGKKGVVRDRKVHEEVVETIISFVKGMPEGHMAVRGLTYSPIRGPEGNIEYLLWMEKNGGSELKEIPVGRIVAAAHEELDH